MLVNLCHLFLNKVVFSAFIWIASIDNFTKQSMLTDIRDAGPLEENGNHSMRCWTTTSRVLRHKGGGIFSPYETHGMFS